MIMVCRVCSHPRRQEIDKKIIRGSNLSELAKQYDAPYNSIWRHKEEHLPGRLALAASSATLRESKNLLAEVDDLLCKTKSILEDSLEKNHNKTALLAVKEVRNSLEFLAKLEFAITQQMERKEQYSEELDEYLKQKEFSRQAEQTAERILSPLEKQVRRELVVKILSGQPLIKIQGINYSLETDIIEDAEIVAPTSKSRMRRTAPGK